MPVPLPNAKQGKVVAELQAQIAQLGNEISSLKNETDPRVAVLQTRVEVLEARDAEWSERLAAAEVSDWFVCIADNRPNGQKAWRASWESLKG